MIVGGRIKTSSREASFQVKRTLRKMRCLQRPRAEMSLSEGVADLSPPRLNKAEKNDVTLILKLIEHIHLIFLGTFNLQKWPWSSREP